MRRIENAFGVVLFLVFAIFVLGSLAPFSGWSGAALTALGALSATFALSTAQARPRFITWAARTSAVAVLLAVIAAVEDQPKVFAVAAIMMAILMTAGALAVLRAVVTDTKVGFRTILGAISVYLSLGVLFGFLFAALDKFSSGPLFGQPAETGDYLFFSLTTLTTTGYGNLVPVGQPGEMFSNVEMLIGQIFLVTLIARLVSMWEPGHWLRAGGGIADIDDPKEQ